MAQVTIKRDNSWVVELNNPLQGPQGEITALTIRPLSLDQIVRWGREEIPSQLALLSEMCGQPERLLLLMTAPDVDRVLVAFSAILPPPVLSSIRDRGAPLATPGEKVAEQPPVPIPDQQDPRFPHVDGDVKRFPTPPQFNPPQVRLPSTSVENAGIDISMPEPMRQVGTNG